MHKISPSSMKCGAECNQNGDTHLVRVDPDGLPYIGGKFLVIYNAGNEKVQERRFPLLFSIQKFADSYMSLQ